MGWKFLSLMNVSRTELSGVENQCFVVFALQVRFIYVYLRNIYVDLHNVIQHKVLENKDYVCTIVVFSSLGAIFHVPFRHPIPLSWPFSHHDPASY